MATSGWKGSATGIASDASTPVICTIEPQEGCSNLWVQVGNGVDAVLDAFTTEVRPHATAGWHTVASVDSDYTTSMRSPLAGCNQDMTTLAKSTTGLMHWSVKGLNGIRFSASGASSDTTLTFYWQVR